MYFVLLVVFITERLRPDCYAHTLYRTARSQTDIDTHTDRDTFADLHTNGYTYNHDQPNPAGYSHCRPDRHRD